jgi:hypothetical protein
MIYDHNNPLTDEQLDKLGKDDFDGFLEYLDGKTAYMKQFTKPLSSYHTKRFAALDKAMRGEKITEEELKKSENIGKKNEQQAFDNVQHKMWKEKEYEVLKKTVKNVKTDRSQWFD